MNSVVICLVLFSFSVFSLLGCANIRTMTRVPSNAEMVEKTIKSASAKVTAIPGLESKDNLAVLSLEIPNSNNSPVATMVNDGISEVLFENGFTIVEREPVVLLKIINESGDSTIDQKDYRIDNRLVVMETPNYITGLPKGFIAPDKIIGYRVLVCGVGFEEFGDDIIRESVVKMKVRMIDVKTGQVLWIGDLEGKEKDGFPMKEFPYLAAEIKKMGYAFYSYPFPVKETPTMTLMEVLSNMTFKGK